jgi:hypothetical protein
MTLRKEFLSLFEKISKLEEFTALSKPKKDVAYHEAAHAVGFVRCGYVFPDVWIGGTWATLIPGSDEADGWVNPGDVPVGPSELIAVLAGYAIDIERGICADDARRTAKGDFDSAKTIDPEKGDLESSVARARAFVRRDRAAIDAVAQELETTDVLSYEDVKRIVHVVDWKNSG